MKGRVQRRDRIEVYATLIRLQHRQALAQMFRPIEKRLGTSRFDREVAALRATCPPRDPNPARWAGAFAALLSERPDIELQTKELCSYLALRIEVELFEDRPWHQGLRPGAVLQAFTTDPRTHDRIVSRTAPVVLALYRDDGDTVCVASITVEAVAAWGVATGETDVERLRDAGVNMAAVERGESDLRALGLLRAR
jgi:hypothetical protein